MEGYSEDNKYIYNYQVIDEAKKVNLEISKDKNKYSYSFVIHNEDTTYRTLIDGVYDNISAIERNINDVIKYRDVSDKDRDVINSSIKDIFGGK